MESKVDERIELEYFKIGSSCGGSQSWMFDPVMRAGGCAALTTCDIFIYLALYRGKSNLIPEIKKLTRREYRDFAATMKPYLHPRSTGIKALKTYMDGVRAYLSDIGDSSITLRGVEGYEAYEVARNAIKCSIDGKVPVAYLMLRHKNRDFQEFDWHWFTVIGYGYKNEEFYIKVATYGESHWLPLKELWDTGFSEKGGIVLFDID